jgi:hypothetical protein
MFSDESDPPTDPFSQLLGRKPTREERERLQRIKSALKLSDNDALWSVLVALEYYDSLYREYPRNIADEVRSCINAARTLQGEGGGQESSTRTSRGSLSATTLGPSWWLPAFLAHQVLFGSVCMTAGFTIGTSGHAVWSDRPAHGAAKVLTSLLGAPSGWMMFALLLPFTVASARAGWAMRNRGSMHAGLVVIVLACFALVASALALIRLL